MRGFYQIIIAGMLLGTVGPMVGLIGDVGPFTVTLFRAALAAMVILAFAAAEGRLKELKVELIDIILFMIFGYIGVTLNFGLFIAAFDYAKMADVVFLSYIHPVITYFLVKHLFGEPFGSKGWQALILMVAGVFLITRPDIYVNTGHLLALGAGLSFAVWSTLLKYFQHDYSSHATLIWPLFFGSMFLLPLALREMRTGLVIPNIGFLLFLGTISTGIAYMFYTKGLNKLEAHVGDELLSITEPLMTLALAYLIFSQTVDLTHIAGGLLVLAAGIRLHPKSRLMMALSADKSL